MGDGLYDGYIADANGNHQKLLMNATLWLANSSASTTDIEIPVINKLDFTIYPNPVKSGTLKFNYIVNEPTSMVNLKILDLTGRLLRELNFPAENKTLQTDEMNVTDFTSGMYLCRLTSGNNSVVKPIIIEK